jgi:hypothetical protein
VPAIKRPELTQIAQQKVCDVYTVPSSTQPMMKHVVVDLGWNPETGEPWIICSCRGDQLAGGCWHRKELDGSV